MGLVIPIILSFNSLFQIVQRTHKSQFITQSIKISNWKCYDTLLGHIVMASSTWYTATELSKKFFSIPATKAMQSSLHALETDDNPHEESWPGLRLSFPPLKYSLKRSSLDILKNILLVLSLDDIMQNWWDEWEVTSMLKALVRHMSCTVFTKDTRTLESGEKSPPPKK